jgi:hypothetical protein
VSSDCKVLSLPLSLPMASRSSGAPASGSGRGWGCNVPPILCRACLRLAAIYDLKNILTYQHMSFLRTLSSLAHVHPGRTSRSVTHRSRPSMLNIGVLSRWGLPGRSPIELMRAQEGLPGRSIAPHTCPHETARVGSDAICNDPSILCRACLRMAAL